MPQNENTPTDTPAMDLETASRVMEQRVTRRAALRKLGFGAGIAALALLTTDDLARMVGKRLEQVAGDNKVAEAVAKELRGAGVAFAGLQPPNPDPCGCNGDCTCNCNCTKQSQIAAACKAYPGCCDSSNVPYGTCTGGFAVQVGRAETQADNCVAGCPPE